MKTTPVADNGYQLTRFGFVNCYLVRESNGFTLVDTGMGSSTAALVLHAAYELGATIRRILLTHAHTDHVGSVDALISKLGASQTELISNARSVPLLKRPVDLSLWQGEPSGKVKGGVPGINTKPTRLLREGDAVGSLRCIETPGHIPGHLSFLDERDGTLYAGDALVGMGDLSISGYAPWYFPLPNVATWNKVVALSSAQKLLNYQVQRFACGHGGVKDGGVEALRAAIAKARS
jgi:glyoxylase-like metal-dependent hydrolase (beta-lactamase superfamily II)